MSAAVALRSFAAVDRFVREVGSNARRPGYVLLGSEPFLFDRCRQGVLEALVPPGSREFGLHDLDLASTAVFDALDLAQTPSLMTPFQVLFLRNLKVLYGRGQKKEEFAALDAYFRSPNPQALLIFVADHLSLPQDLRTMDMQDRERAERVRETLGDACSIVELQQVSAEDAAAWATTTASQSGITLEADAARELVDALGANMLAVQSELEKLMLYATSGTMAGAAAQAAGTRGPHITMSDIETMVSGAKQRSLYELTDAISLKDAPRALLLLGGLLNASEAAEEASIGHVFSLAKVFRQMLVLQEKGVRDQRGMWAVLWPGFRVPAFAADALIAQARRYRERDELTRSLRSIAWADLQLRSSPPDKRLVLERLVLDLARRPSAKEAAVR